MQERERLYELTYSGEGFGIGPEGGIRGYGRLTKIELVQEEQNPPIEDVTTSKMPPEPGRRLRRLITPVRIALATLLLAGAAAGISAYHVWGQKEDEETTPIAGMQTPTPNYAGASPTPEATPTVTPTLVFTGDTSRPKRTFLLFRGLKPGESFDAPTNSIVVGDVAVNEKMMFDSKQETGLIVDLRQPAKIEAPFGAAVQINIKPEDRGKILDQNIQIMKKSGCVSGCQTVDVVVFPGGKPQGQ